MNSRILVAVLAGAALAAGGCASGDGDEPGVASPNDEFVFHSASIVALDSAENAVTWSDTVAMFTVVSERALEGAPTKDGSPVIGRRVSVKLTDVIWKRGEGKQPPEVFETQASGWYSDDGGKLIPMRSDDGIRLEVGSTYIAAVVYVFDEWGFDESVLEVVDGRVNAAPQQDFALASELDGKTSQKVAEVLRGAKPAPESGALAGTTEEQLEAIGVDVG